MVLYVKHYYHLSTDSPSCCPAFQNTTTPKASPPLLANGENDARHVVCFRQQYLHVWLIIYLVQNEVNLFELPSNNVTG